MAHQLSSYLTSADSLPMLYSLVSGPVTRRKPSDGLRVTSDILLAVDRGDFATLLLLDLSAAFDTVDHDILLRRLQTTLALMVLHSTSSGLIRSPVRSTSGVVLRCHRSFI